MSGVLDDLRQKWAEEAAERAEMDAVIDLQELDLEDSAREDGPVDRERALAELHSEPDDDQFVPRRRS